ncbi:hypothetical protein [Pseudomonas tremae]|uniref:hypothetical protein n=1 Tax=Pseudomonas tremae TaxID=200454 RepID=UPI001FA068B7|nr:hypothetical protein [Pseudomonas tremae]MCF5715230.1 hypothetical protein [Pseudomonas tremae]
MMGKKKTFIKTDLSIPVVNNQRSNTNQKCVITDRLPPDVTKVDIGKNPTRMRWVDFERWYRANIDEIAYACQRQIERFVLRQDRDIEPSTVASLCKGGLKHFLDYAMLRAKAYDRELRLADINRNLIDGFLGYLSDLAISRQSQRSTFTAAKSILMALCTRGLIAYVDSGDDATFPKNPFPNTPKPDGETAIPKSQRQEVAAALKSAIAPIWEDGVIVTSSLLSYALLTVALHTGKNTTPLLEMDRNCLRPHPKDDLTFLVLWKRRGHTSYKSTLRSPTPEERTLESTPTVRTNIELLIRRVLHLTSVLLADAPESLANRAWIYRAQASARGSVVELSDGMLKFAIDKLVKQYGLTDTDGKPLRLNVSRLRKTFANRVYELLGGNIQLTAIALGNTPAVAEQAYLRPTVESKRNWKFMGEFLVKELMTKTIGETFHTTPVGKCRDPQEGQFAPKSAGAACFSFLNCVRCKHYAVTGDDLYKLFSFYYRIYSERSNMGKLRWEKELSHIPRLIDNYIIAEGLRRKVFKPSDVEAARIRAKNTLHPFWACDTLSSLEAFA